MFGMYGSSPKVKRGGPITHIVGKACATFFQWIAELRIPSRDRVSISPRSCVDFVRCAQAEIVCRFRQVIDWGTLEIGSDLENLRRGGELLEREKYC